MYTVECSENFTINHTVKKEGEITYIDLTAQAIDAPGKLTLAVKWNYPLIGAHLSWSPIPYAIRGVTPTWGMDKTESNAMRSAPVRSYVSYDDTNGITVACSDAKNNVCIQMGLKESSASLACGVFIRVDCDIAEYSARIRIDERKIPFTKCIEDVAAWWETFDGYTPAPVPEAARKPVYSTWYSYHQSIFPDALLRECEYFHGLGCDTIIVDDGWHTAVKGGVYSTCGDWIPSEEKFPDMRGFVHQVHEIGMKIMLWYTVPFMGENTMCY
jgi:alpha-galactosidase